MEKIKLNEYQNIFYFIWNDSDETIKMVNEYLKITRGDNWICGRCWNEETNSNTSKHLYISESRSNGKTNNYYNVGEYVIDFRNYFRGLTKDQFDSNEFIEQWKQQR